MKNKKISIFDLNLQIYSWGSSQKIPLLMLHGWLDTGAGFHFLAEHLSDHFFCVAPDLRGYGRSQHSSNPLGYFFYEYVADVKAMIDQLFGQRKIILLGHSLGGAVASAYAGMYSDSLKALINLEGFGFQQRSKLTAPQRVNQWLESLGKMRFAFYDSLESFAQRLIQSNPRLPLERAKFLAKFLTTKTPEGYRMSADEKHKLIEPYAFQAHGFEEFWQNISAPSLFVAAQESEFKKFYPKQDYWQVLQEQKSRFPKQCQLVLLPDAGHMMHHEKPQALAKMILDYSTNLT